MWDACVNNRGEGDPHSRTPLMKVSASWLPFLYVLPHTNSIVQIQTLTWHLCTPLRLASWLPLTTLCTTINSNSNPHLAPLHPFEVDELVAAHHQLFQGDAA